MNATVQCSQCLKRYEAPEHLAGRRVNCPACGAAVDVPYVAATVPNATVVVPVAKLVEEDIPTAVPSSESKTLGPRAKSTPKSLPRSRPKPTVREPEPFRRRRRKASHSRRHTSGPDPGSPAVGICVTIGMVLLGLSILMSLYLLIFFLEITNGVVIFVALLSFIPAVFSTYGFFAGMGLAFSEGVGHGLLCLTGVYWLYYVLSRWHTTKTAFLMWLVGVSLNVALEIYSAVRARDSTMANIRRGQAHAETLLDPSDFPSGPTMHPSYSPNFSNIPSPPRTPSVPLLSYRSIPVPSFPARGTSRTLEPGVEFFEVDLNVRSGQPGQADTLYVYLPSGEQKPESISCLLIAAAGGTAFSGMGLGRGDQVEHIPYVKEGLAVVAYEVDGELPDDADQNDFLPAYQKFSAAKAGLVNARNAMEFVKARMPEVDPRHIYVAGHSSAGTLALLFAEHESGIRGCMAYAPVCNVARDLGPDAAILHSVLPGSEAFFKSCSPHSHVSRLRIPVFLFHAKDDGVVSSQQTLELSRLISADTLHQVARGGHYEAMINEGIPAAIEWLMRDGTISGGPPPIGKPPREWAYQPDAAPTSAVILAPSPISLQSDLWSIHRVAFTSSETGQAVVLGDLPFGTVYLERIDLRHGVSMGRLPLTGECTLADVTPDGTLALVVAKGHAKIWSLDAGNLIADWRFSQGTMRGNGWGAFIDHQRIATLDGGGHLAVWSLPDCQEVYAVEKVTRVAVSPERKHLAIFGTFDRFWPGKLIDAATGDPRGSLASPGREIEVRRCAFRHDGLRVAAGGKNGFAIWDLQTGAIDTEFSRSIDDQQIKFAGEDYVLVDGELFDTKRRARVWEYDVSDHGGRWHRTIGTPDGRVWLVAATSHLKPAYLGPIAIPTEEVTTGLANPPSRPGFRSDRSEITLQDLFGTQPVPASAFDRPPWRPGAGTQPAAVPPVASVVGDAAFAKTARDYVQRAHVEMIVDDGTLVKDRLRWYAAVKRPTIGLRWGLGVLWTGGDNPSQVQSPEQLAKVTGPTGTAIVVGLQQRIDKGKFGDWPASGDSRLRQVALLGAGKHGDLVEAAARQRIDGLVIASISTRFVGTTGKTDMQMKIRLVDVAGELPTWTSPSLSNSRITAGKAAGEDPEAELAEAVLAQIDAGCSLRPMPTLKPEHVERRVATLAKDLFQADKEELLRVLVELRYYQVMGLLPTAEATLLYGNILGSGKGRILAGTDPDQRREAVETWLKSD